jgi:hypothetical protein
MSREKIVRVVSDLSGTAYEGEEFPPVKLSINGKSGARDLTPGEAAAMEKFITTGDAADLRKILAPVTAPAPARKGKGKGSHSSNDENTAIREWWATAEGRKATDTEPDADIPARGRIPANVREAYAKRAG